MPLPDIKRFAVARLTNIGTRYLPFADVASDVLPLSRLLRLSLFQVTVGMALVLMVGTLNRVMIVELKVPATLVALMLALPLVFAPFRALIGFRSDNYRSALGLRRLPYIFKGSMLQFGGFAIMPFALLVLSGYGEAIDATRWIGLSAAALAFLMVGAGVHMVQTVGLALATDLVPAEDQPKIVGLMYVVLLVGMIASAFIFGALLENYTPGRLIQVIQGSAVVTLLLNGIAMWKQEARDRTRAHAPRIDIGFSDAWAKLTAGFGMADVLLEPFGGQVLAMSVAETTRLTVVLALVSLVGFGLASRWLGRGARPLAVAALGAGLGVPAFGSIMASGLLVSTPMLIGAVLLAGFGAGLFGHGTLTATMRSAPRDQIGLSLGAWGAVQTTAAGVAIALGGVIRDALQASGANGALTARPYLPVFALEAALLVLAVIVALQMLRKTIDAGHRADTIDIITKEGAGAVADRLRAAEVGITEAAAYAGPVGAGKALVVVRAPFAPMGTAQHAIRTVNRFEAIDVGLSDEDIYIRVEPDSKYQIKVMTDHPLLMSNPHRSLPSGHIMGRNPLLPSKPRTSAIRGGRHMSSKFWPMKLVSTGRNANSAIKGGWQFSSLLGIPTLIRDWGPRDIKTIL